MPTLRTTSNCAESFPARVPRLSSMRPVWVCVFTRLMSEVVSSDRAVSLAASFNVPAAVLSLTRIVSTMMRASELVTNPGSGAPTALHASIPLESTHTGALKRPSCVLLSYCRFMPSYSSLNFQVFSASPAVLTNT